MTSNSSKYSSFFWILLFSVIASLILSAWSGYAQQIPNPDATYYLRAAELFEAGRWEEALKVYRWPFYSMTIAAAMKLTSASAFVGAQLINAIFDCLIVVIFVGLAKALATEKTAPTIAFWAAVLILLHPRLTVIRPVIIRDHGFHAFSLAALYFVAKDHHHPQVLNKVLSVGCILLAALFRLEALYLLVVVPTFYLFARASSIRTKLLSIGGVLLTCAVLLPAATIWTTGTVVPQALSQTLTFSEIAIPLRHLTNTISVMASKFQSILPPSRNAGGLSYIGTVVALTIDSTLRAITIPLAVLALLGFFPRRLTSPFAASLVAWFAWWQIPVLLAFTTINLFLDWRYAVLLAFLLAIPATYTVQKMSEDARCRTASKQFIFFSALLALIVPWLLTLPRPSDLEHLRQAGIWITDNVPQDARVWVNDNRIAYYSGRTYNTTIATPMPANVDWPNSDYAAIEIKGASDKFLSEKMQRRLLKVIQGRHDHSVYIYKPAAPQSP